MIHNDAELAVVREQTARVESALHSLAREVRPKSDERYLLMAEPYEDQLEELRGQVAAYLSSARGRERTTAAG